MLRKTATSTAASLVALVTTVGLTVQSPAANAMSQNDDAIGVAFLQANYAAKLAGKPYFLADGQVVTDPPSQAASMPAGFSCIRFHESTNRYNITSGAYGILLSTWHSSDLASLSAGYPTPGSAPPSVQDQAALILYHKYGWKPWSTAATCGLG